MRLIDADTLSEVFGIGRDCAHCQLGREKCEEDWVSTIEICGTIAEEPTVDAVEVVRCKDCRKNPKRSIVGCPMAGQKTWTEDGFCFMGEKVT